MDSEGVAWTCPLLTTCSITESRNALTAFSGDSVVATPSVCGEPVSPPSRWRIAVADNWGIPLGTSWPGSKGTGKWISSRELRTCKDLLSSTREMSLLATVYKEQELIPSLNYNFPLMAWLQDSFPGMELTSIIPWCFPSSTKTHASFVGRGYLLVAEPVSMFSGCLLIVTGFDTSLSCRETIFPAIT